MSVMFKVKDILKNNIIPHEHKKHFPFFGFFRNITVDV